MNEIGQKRSKTVKIHVYLTIFEAEFQVGQSFFVFFALGVNSRLFA